MFTDGSFLLGPFLFSQGLFKWPFCGSKSVHTLPGALTASGSIAILQKFLNNSASETNKCFPTGDIEVFADNTQSKGETIRVRENATTPIGIATNVVFIQANRDSILQSREDLSPEEWGEKTDNNSLIEKINNYENSLNVEISRKYRYDSQQKTLLNVNRSLSKGEDAIDIMLQREDDNIHVCGYYLEVNEKSSYSCSSCSVSFKTFHNSEELYENVPSRHPEKTPHIKLGEIIVVNPNSYETVKQVLLNILEQAEVPQKRKWVRVGFDGVPYRIAADLIVNVKQCTICNALIDLKVETEDEHHEECHSEKENIILKKAFGRILLMCGAGHMEKNLLLATFKFCKVSVKIDSCRVVRGTKISLVFSL